MNTALTRVIEEIRGCLKDYLSLNNIEPDHNGFFKCISREHSDRSPSMKLDPTTDEQTVHCFGCGANYNTFQCANQLEDKADHGPSFILETIPYLAAKFGIPYNKDDLVVDPATLEIYRYRQLYEDAASILKKIASMKFTTERGWSEEVCRREGIGTVDWQEFATALCKRGNYTEEELKYRDIKISIFNSNCVVFPVRDQYGRVCGFASRNMTFSKEDKSTHPKFRNTSDTVPIYNKSELLYGIHIASKYIDMRLDIFEGYPDWVTAQQHGYHNCVSLGGTALTQSHIDIIKRLGFTHINLVLDGDQTGITKNRQLLEKYAYNTEGLKVTMMSLPFSDGQPESQRDPDDYFKEYGKNSYLLIRPLSVFDIKLTEAVSGVTIEPGKVYTELASKMVPFLIMETSPIERGRMIKDLSKLTSVSEEDIKEEVRRKADKAIREIAVNLQSRLAKASDTLEIKDLIEQANSRIQRSGEKKDLASFHMMETLSHLDNWYKERMDPTDKATGWMTGYPNIDDPMIMGGIPKKECIITFAGAPNHGKSAILLNIAKQLIMPQNANRDLAVLLWCLDDPRNVAWHKLMASILGVPISDIQRPTGRLLSDPESAKSYKEWFEFTRECVRSGRFILKGHEIGNDLSSLEYWIKHVQDTTGRNIVLFVDALNDMKTGNSHTDENERLKFVRVYDWFQSSTELMNYTVLTCAHVTKIGIAKGRPEQSDLSETGKGIYASKIIGMVYSEFDHIKSRGGYDSNISMCWIDDEDTDSIDKRKPIVEVSITKNKISSFKGQLFFKHKSDACHITPISQADAMKLKKASSNYTAQYNAPGTSEVGTLPAGHTMLIDDIGMEM